MELNYRIHPLETRLNMPLTDSEYNKARALSHYYKNSDLFNHIYGKGQTRLKGNISEEEHKKHNKRVINKWSYNKPEKKLISAAKARAKKSGLGFNIKDEDIVIPTHCPILGIKLEKGADNIQTSPSLDRIDSSKGYIKGNVHVISMRANTIKNSATPEELDKIAKYMKTLCI